MLTAEEWTILALTLRVAAVGLLIGLPLAVLTAYALARWRFPGRGLLNAVVHLPLVMPPVVTGYLLLLAFGRKGVIGVFLEETLGIIVAFRWTGAAIAAAVMALPLMVRPIRLAIETVDVGLERAAETLGASVLTRFATITLPIALPGIIAAAILGFAKAMGEFGATITFVSNIPGETRTIALAVHTLAQVPGGEIGVYRLMILSVAVSLIALIASEVLARRLARNVGHA